MDLVSRIEPDWLSADEKPRERHFMLTGSLESTKGKSCNKMRRAEEELLWLTGSHESAKGKAASKGLEQQTRRVANGKGFIPSRRGVIVNNKRATKRKAHFSENTEIN